MFPACPTAYVASPYCFRRPTNSKCPHQQEWWSVPRLGLSNGSVIKVTKVGLSLEPCADAMCGTAGCCGPSPAMEASPAISSGPASTSSPAPPSTLVSTSTALNCACLRWGSVSPVRPIHGPSCLGLHVSTKAMAIFCLNRVSPSYLREGKQCEMQRLPGALSWVLSACPNYTCQVLWP